MGKRMEPEIVATQTEGPYELQRKIVDDLFLKLERGDQEVISADILSFTTA